MKINNPKGIVGKEVFDANGKLIGFVDKMWNSWNKKHPGIFFGVNPNRFIRDACFRGTQKLIPIYSDFIRDVGESITLNKTIEELHHFWNMTISCGSKSYPSDELLDVGVYDKENSRVGTFYTTVDGKKGYKKYGILLDPYICDLWNAPGNTLMPIPIKYISLVNDTITLSKTLDELKQYWKLHYKFLSEDNKN
jgi:hypothetical protein